MPGMGMPSVDPEEIARKLGELKNVETWLTMNVGLVQMTIRINGVGVIYCQHSAAEKPGSDPKRPHLDC